MGIKLEIRLKDYDTLYTYQLLCQLSEMYNNILNNQHDRHNPFKMPKVHFAKFLDY